jgi:hypothetical protein
MNFGRLFKITEKTSLSIRAEFTNIFNRTEQGNPTSTNALATQGRNPAGQTTGSFGFHQHTLQRRTAAARPDCGAIPVLERTRSRPGDGAAA